MNRIDEQQDLINSLWHTLGPPDLTFGEGVRAFKKIHRFVFGRTYEYPIVHNNRGDSWQYEYTDGRVGHEYRINTAWGWQRFVHDIALFTQADELTLVREVLKRGWLDGRLADRLIPPEERKAAARAKKVQSINDRITRWEAKERRARTALKKLRSQLKRLELRG